jgi:hypothetical protein
LTIVFCAIVIAVLSMIFFDYAVIIGTSIFGAYLFIRVNYCYVNCFNRVFLNIWEDSLMS